MIWDEIAVIRLIERDDGLAQFFDIATFTVKGSAELINGPINYIISLDEVFKVDAIAGY
jgi:hypothetical protein